jgi:hypothetical protein
MNRTSVSIARAIGIATNSVIATSAASRGRAASPDGAPLFAGAAVTRRTSHGPGYEQVSPSNAALQAIARASRTLKSRSSGDGPKRCLPTPREHDARYNERQHDE